MLLFENIQLALNGLRANKMRALLTMLGIIIGIGSVIAIVTVGDSLSGSLTDSLQSFGVGNITVSLQQKTESDSGGGVRMFSMAQPSEEDLISDAMLEEYQTAYADSIYAISLESGLGSGTVGSGEDTASVQVTGVNAQYADANELELLCGRFIKDSDGERQLAVVSDLACETLFGRADSSVLGQSFQVTVGQKLLTFYVAGVYEYDDSGYFSMTGEDPVTEMYIPLAAAQKLGETDEGYQNFTVVAAAGTFGYELDPGKLTQEEKEAVKAQVADYHKYYDLTHYGDFYRITSPTEDPYLCDWAFVSPDKSEVLFTRVVMRQPINLYRPLRLPGLDPDKLYTDEETGHVYSGALLMHGGLDLSANDFSSHDGEAVVKHFVAKA